MEPPIAEGTESVQAVSCAPGRRRPQRRRQRGQAATVEMALIFPVFTLFLMGIIECSRAFYTWTDADSEFAPWRLDWLQYSDATLMVVDTYSLDTARMSNTAMSIQKMSRPAA